MSWEQEAAERLAALLPPTGVVRVALSGGSTPGPVYRAFKPLVDWSRIELFFCDERCVPPEHPDSNYRLAKECFADIRPKFVYRMKGELEPKTAADEYEKHLTAPLDLAILGVGEDGHTASLFPGTAALKVKDRNCVASETPKGWRLTLTLPYLNAARAKVFLARKDKAQILELLRKKPKLPAALIKDAEWLVEGN